MKKVIIILLIIQYAIAASSQEWSFGIKSGISISKTIISDSDEKMEPIAGLIVGASVRYTRNQFYLKPELLIVQKGFKIKQSSYRLNTLDLPINLGYSFPLKKKLKLFTEIGGYVSMEVNHEIRYNEAFRVYDNVNVLKDLDYGISLGIGFQYLRTHLACNYFRGFTNIPNVINKNMNTNMLAISVIFKLY